MGITPVPVRLALCSSGELFGGVEEHISILSGQTAAKPQMTTLVVLFNPGLLAERLRASGVHTKVLRGRHKYNPFVLFDVVRLLRRHSINVVHVHGYRATIICGLAAKMAGARLIKTEHGAVEPMGHPWARARMRTNLAFDRLVTGRLVERVVYVSRDLLARLSPPSGQHERWVIPNGIEPPAADDEIALPELNLGDFNVAIVGRLVEVKGHSVLLRAMAGLRDCPGLVTHVFGDGRLEGALRQECAALGIERQVCFHGFRSDIIRCMRAMDAIVMPSYHEGVPYTLLQAMSLGLPVVASRVGGLCEVLEDGKDAILTAPGDAGAVAGALRTLYGDRTAGRTLGQHARAKVLQRYSAEAMADRYMALYQDLLGHG